MYEAETAQGAAPPNEKARSIMKHKSSKPPDHSRPGGKDVSRYPRGLNRRKVEAIISHYENQTEEEAVAEDEAAYHKNKVTMMGVPVELVPKVQKLIAKRSG
jgi:hypothetical protein